MSSDDGVACADIDYYTTEDAILFEGAAKVTPSFIVDGAGVVFGGMYLRATELADIGVEEEFTQLYLCFFNSACLFEVYDMGLCR